MTIRDIPIVIPSAGRADTVLTQVTGAILYVPESEAAAYAESNPGTTIESHSDNAHRNLAAKRQDIYTRWGDVFMLDDDIDRIVRKHLTGNPRDHHLNADEAADLIQRTYWQATHAGAYLFGFSSSPNAKHYYAHKPISLTAYINACAMGLRKSEKLYFTERTTAAESHWINLLNAAMHRYAWVDTRFCFAQAPNSTFFRPGGQTAHRTRQSEMDDTIFLRRMFGPAVQVKRGRGDASKTHPYQRTIANPL